MTVSLRNTLFASAFSGAMILSSAAAQDVPEVDLVEQQNSIISQVLEYAVNMHPSGASYEDLYAIVTRSMIEQAANGVTDPEEITATALNEALHTLDPHSSLIPRSDMQAMREQTRGSFFGIGARVAYDNEQAVEDYTARRNAYIEEFEANNPDTPLTREMVDDAVPPLTLDRGLRIQETMGDESPANLAGVEAGDLVTHADGESLSGMTVEQAVDLIKGPRGSDVALTIERDGVDAPLQITVTRDEVRQNPVQTRMVDDATGYISVSTFNNQTDVNVDRAIQELTASGAERFILDLRNNTGGLLNEADAMIENFIDGDPEVPEIFQRQSRRWLENSRAAFESVFLDENSEFIPERADSIMEELTLQDRAIVVRWTQNEQRFSPQLIGVLERAGLIEQGAYVPQLTPEEIAILDANVTIHQRDVNGKSPVYYATPGAETDAPMVVLTNGFSASASEIVAGVLQSYDRATIIGTQSFGKGSVQAVVPIDGDNDNVEDVLMRLTTSYYYIGQGQGFSLQGSGITPDIVLSEEFTNVSEAGRSEAGLDASLAAPEDANFTLQSAFECVPSTVTVEVYDMEVGEYSTADIDDPWIACAMEFFDADAYDFVGVTPLVEDETAPESEIVEALTPGGPQ